MIALENQRNLASVVLFLSYPFKIKVETNQVPQKTSLICPAIQMAWKIYKSSKILVKRMRYWKRNATHSSTC